MTQSMIKKLIKTYPVLSNCEKSIEQAYKVLVNCFKNNKLLVCGNGGSAADANHIVAELMKDFCKCRKICPKVAANLNKTKDGKYLSKKLMGALPAISLCNESGLMTAIANDTDPNLIFAQQVYGLGNKNDVLFAISTSGNAKNVYYAALTAKALGMKVIALTGKTGGKLKDIADVVIRVNLYDTYKIQELHLPIYHTLCLMLEKELF